eukprot:TRINITY_DN27985_c0_g1_i1.p1 TRINITY_DN27985_c0_g1~~TRINITY_DN27985_c0_g1_i1.p1  ORF type:complete len:506 (-),score=97.35 TRINITY_DN27985_c0_g1_i1:214-1731(-)
MGPPMSERSFRSSSSRASAAALQEAKLQLTAKQISAKAADRFGSVKEWLSSLPTDCRGEVSRHDAMKLFKDQKLGVSQRMANDLFDRASDGNGEGTVNLSKLQQMLRKSGEPREAERFGEPRLSQGSPPSDVCSVRSNLSEAQQSSRLAAPGQGEGMLSAEPRQLREFRGSGEDAMAGSTERQSCNGKHRSASQPSLGSNQGDDPELEEAFRSIGEMSAQRFSTARKAFRKLDSDHNGRLSKTEIHTYLRGFGWEHVTDKLFKHLDRDGSGFLNFQEFQEKIAPYIQPGHQHACFKPTRRSVSVTARDMTSEGLKMAELLGLKAGAKFLTVRKAFRHLDHDKDGVLERKEVRDFFELNGFDRKAADLLFDEIDRDKSGIIRFGEFQGLLGPYIQPNHSVNKPWEPLTLPTRQDVGVETYVRDRDLERTVAQITQKAGQKYKSMRTAFRAIDADHSGMVTRKEVQKFFANYNFENGEADALFDKLDKDGNGTVTQAEFQSVFTQAL